MRTEVQGPWGHTGGTSPSPCHTDSSQGISTLLHVRGTLTRGRGLVLALHHLQRKVTLISKGHRGISWCGMWHSRSEHVPWRFRHLGTVYPRPSHLTSLCPVSTPVQWESFQWLRQGRREGDMVVGTARRQRAAQDYLPPFIVTVICTEVSEGYSHL